MTQASTSESFPSHFQRQALNLINGLLPLSSSGFYLVGTNLGNRWAVFHNLDVEQERIYHDKYRELDPLNPSLFAETGERVVSIDEQLQEAELLDSVYYREFMMPLRHRHVADIFLRNGRDIVAVITNLREIDLGPFSAEELALMRKLQPFLEYTLNSVYLPRRYRERDNIQRTYKLTVRELDVVELIVGGASNKAIARELGVSLATIKTHIQHIFHKVDVPSRTALSARVLGELNA